MIIEYLQSSEEEEIYCFSWEKILSDHTKEWLNSTVTCKLTYEKQIGKQISSTFSYHRELLRPLTTIQFYVDYSQIKIHRAFIKQLNELLSFRHRPFPVEGPLLPALGEGKEYEIGDPFKPSLSGGLASSSEPFSHAQYASRVDPLLSDYSASSFLHPVPFAESRQSLEEGVYIVPNSQASEEEQSDAFSSSSPTRPEDRHTAKKTKHHEHDPSEPYEAFISKDPEGPTKTLSKEELLKLVRVPKNQALSREQTKLLESRHMPKFKAAKNLLADITKDEHEQLIALSRRSKNREAAQKSRDRNSERLEKYRESLEKSKTLIQQLNNENKLLKEKEEELTSTMEKLVSEISWLREALAAQQPSKAADTRISDPRLFRGPALRKELRGELRGELDVDTPPLPKSIRPTNGK